jgi:hypothetical protein
MSNSEVTIDALKARLKADTDTDLARKLAIDKRTVSAWRARGTVPNRYLDIIEGADHQTIATPPLRWGEYENYALRLALFRISRATAPAALSDDPSTVYKTFTFTTLWQLFRQSQEDLVAAMEGRTEFLDTALVLVIADDIAAGQEAVERHRSLMNWQQQI